MPDVVALSPEATELDDGLTVDREQMRRLASLAAESVEPPTVSQPVFKQASPVESPPVVRQTIPEAAPAAWQIPPPPIPSSQAPPPQPTVPQSPGLTAGPPRVGSRAEWLNVAWQVPAGIPSPPRQLWGVIGTLFAVGAVSVCWSLYWGYESLSLFSDGSMGVALGAFLLVVLAIPLCFGLGSILVGRRLQAGDRVARVVAVVLYASAAAAFLLTGVRDLVLVLVAFACLGIAGMLTFDRATRAHFTGVEARYGAEPSTVVAARVLMVAVGCGMFLVGVMFLPLAELEGILALYGVIEIGLALLVFVVSRRLAKADRSARVVATALVIAYLIVALVGGHGQPGVILPVVLAIGVIGLLWVPGASRRYFESLPVPTQPAFAAIDRSIAAALAAVSSPPHPGEPSPPMTMDLYGSAASQSVGPDPTAWTSSRSELTEVKASSPAPAELEKDDHTPQNLPMPPPPLQAPWTSGVSASDSSQPS